jgi:hypothetical protein
MGAIYLANDLTFNEPVAIKENFVQTGSGIDREASMNQKYPRYPGKAAHSGRFWPGQSGRHRYPHPPGCLAGVGEMHSLVSRRCKNHYIFIRAKILIPFSEAIEAGE